MDFRPFNLTPEPLSPKRFLPTKMGDEHLYSYPLTGHLDGAKSTQNSPWSYLTATSLGNHFKFSIPHGIMPTQSKMCDFKKNVLSYVVGGFVGSKSQRNSNNSEPFPIGEVIVDLLQQGPNISKKEDKQPVNSSQFVENMMSNFIIGLSGQSEGGLLAGFSIDVPDTKKETSIFRNDGADDSCLSRALRLISECSVDSNDTDFVVFEGTTTCILADDDDWLDDSDLDCDDDDPVDERLDEANEKWDSYYGDTPVPTHETCTPSKVHFNDKPSVRVMHMWDFAHRAARVGPWEEAARDRSRFKDRIRRTEEILAPALDKHHRLKVWQRLQQNR